MKTKMIISKKGNALYEGVHEIIDAESFGRACAGAWARIQDRRLQKSTSIGALMEVLNEEMLEALDGAEIRFEKI